MASRIDERSRVAFRMDAACGVGALSTWARQYLRSVVLVMVACYSLIGSLGTWICTTSHNIPSRQRTQLRKKLKTEQQSMPSAHHVHTCPEACGLWLCSEPLQETPFDSWEETPVSTLHASTKE